MPGQARLGDKAKAWEAHGCSACPHPVCGPAVQCSGNVTADGRPAVRKGDRGIHAPCCGTNTWRAKGASSTVTINGKPAFRYTDETQHCSRTGELIEGSSSVIVGNSQSKGFSRAARTGAPAVCDCDK